MNYTAAGWVGYDREKQYCDDCRKITTNVRAKRMPVGWVSDWSCIKEVEGKPHPKAEQFRKQGGR